MFRPHRLIASVVLFVLFVLSTMILPVSSTHSAEVPKLRVGIIGLDTSHAPAFAKLLNAPKPAPELAHCRVVAAYPHGSADIESSVSRIPKYTEQLREMGISIEDSIDSLLKKVDVVLLETNDGRPHLQQAFQVIKAGKPLFIDKPIAGSLVDTIAIFELAKKHQVPIFSSSSLRFSKAAQEVRQGAIGRVNGSDVYSPCHLEKTHPDLFWYGIHGVETLFTVMGSGCESVTRADTPNTDLVVGKWKDGRVGTFRGIRNYSAGYGGTAFGDKGIKTVGPYDGYRPLVVEIVRFFRSGKPPVSAKETTEIYAFMEAADVSKRRQGASVSIGTLIEQTRSLALKKIAELD